MLHPRLTLGFSQLGMVHDNNDLLLKLAAASHDANSDQFVRVAYSVKPSNPGLEQRYLDNIDKKIKIK